MEADRTLLRRAARRIDVEVRSHVDGNLQVDVQVPGTLAPAVALLLAALGVRASERVR